MENVLLPFCSYNCQSDLEKGVPSKGHVPRCLGIRTYSCTPLSSSLLPCLFYVTYLIGILS